MKQKQSEKGKEWMFAFIYLYAHGMYILRDQIFKSWSDWHFCIFLL